VLSGSTRSPFSCNCFIFFFLVWVCSRHTHLATHNLATHKSRHPGDYTRAERVYVKQGQVDEAIEMYQTLHRWDDAIKVAEQASHKDVEQMKSDYFGYLRDSGQEETAAELKAQEGDYVTAINLYLKGGYPARAAHIVKQHDVRSGGQQLLERIANDMTRAGMHERAGEFYEMLDQLDRALELYLQGRAYRPAVELVREVFIVHVVHVVHVGCTRCALVVSLSVPPTI
jgi:intraflagellar transport protein 172